MTFLLVGTDSGNPAPTGAVDGGPTGESIQLLRVSSDRRSAAVAGISRDTLVDVPGAGPGPISQTYTTGGPSSLVAAVERLSGVRVDHFAVVDLARAAREQNVIRAVLRKALATGILTEPAKTYATLDARRL